MRAVEGTDGAAVGWGGRHGRQVAPGGGAARGGRWLGEEWLTGGAGRMIPRIFPEISN